MAKFLQLDIGNKYFTPLYFELSYKIFKTTDFISCKVWCVEVHTYTETKENRNPSLPLCFVPLRRHLTEPRAPGFQVMLTTEITGMCGDTPGFDMGAGITTLVLTTVHQASTLLTTKPSL